MEAHVKETNLQEQQNIRATANTDFNRIRNACYVIVNGGDDGNGNERELRGNLHLKRVNELSELLNSVELRNSIESNVREILQRKVEIAKMLAEREIREAKYCKQSISVTSDSKCHTGLYDNEGKPIIIIGTKLEAITTC